jgi:TRAP-type C4-dicarboxylate transport system substrate-binding protein
MIDALFSTAASTRAIARQFRAADTRFSAVGALRSMGGLIAKRSSGRHHIRVFHSRQPGEEKATVEQARVGRPFGAGTRRGTDRTDSQGGVN